MSVIKKMSLVALALSFLSSASLQARLVEDGSSFTGNYKIVEKTPTCTFFTTVKSPYEPQSQDGLLNVGGTPYGINLIGKNMLSLKVGSSKFVGGDDFLHEVSGEYKSGKDFHGTDVFSFKGDKTTTTSDWTVDAQNNLVMTSTSYKGDDTKGATTEVCHFERIQ